MKSQPQENPVPLQQIHSPLLERARVSLFVQREDLVHPTLSGNKWYKLKYNILEAVEQGYERLLTFGGAFSNHIYATAAAGQVYGLKTVGIIRGEETLPLNHTLQSARVNGMHLHYVDRQTYRDKQSSELIEQLHYQFGNFYLLPEGGANQLAIRGCIELGRHASSYDFVCASMGTGGTLAGMAIAMNGKGNLMGFPALKNGSFLLDEVNQLTNLCRGNTYGNIIIVDEFHFGGYARFKPPLIQFINEFYQQHQIPLDPVYNGKMMYGIFEMIRRGEFPVKSKILAIHTGGLQGVKGYNERFGNKAPISFNNFEK